MNPEKYAALGVLGFLEGKQHQKFYFDMLTLSHGNKILTVTFLYSNWQGPIFYDCIFTEGSSGVSTLLMLKHLYTGVTEEKVILLSRILVINK